MNRHDDEDVQHLELEQDPSMLDQHPDEEAYTNDSSDALRQMQLMPSDTQEQIRKMLHNDESLVFVEKPSRWRSTWLFSSIVTFQKDLPSLFEGYLRD
jgi:23S rRNA-/tRNA-specific pseudouridylate synthase